MKGEKVPSDSVRWPASREDAQAAPDVPPDGPAISPGDGAGATAEVGEVEARVAGACREL